MKLQELVDSDLRHFLLHTARNLIICGVIFSVALGLDRLHDYIQSNVTQSVVVLGAILLVEWCMLAADVVWFIYSLALDTWHLMRKRWQRELNDK